MHGRFLARQSSQSRNETLSFGAGTAFVVPAHAEIGEGLGQSLAPPIDFTGATGFRFGCSYENTTAQTIEGGAAADHEMCSFIMQTDWKNEFYGVIAPGFADATIVDHGMTESGEHDFSVSGCALLLTPNG